MITFGSMPPLAVPRSPSKLPALSRIAARRLLGGLVALLALAPGVALAQTALSHTSDAAPIPRGALRFSIASGWTRYDGRFSDSGSIRGLGDYFSTDSLGPRQLPNLGPVEGAFQTLSNNAAQRLTLGRLAVQSDARIVTTPIAVEYGVTRRLSFGFLVPIVQTRRSAQVQVNIRAAGDTVRTSNTGLIPVGSREGVAASAQGIVTALTTASTSLSALVGRCQTNSAAAECDRIRGREAEAAAAAQRAATFAAAVRAAYGTTEQTAIVAPLAGSPLAKEIEAQRAALAAQLATFAPGTTIGTLFNAPTEFSYADLQGRNGTAGLLQSDLGGGLDSIHTTNRIGFGDVELRAGYLLLDHTHADSLSIRGLQYRLAVGGSLRFATSRVDSARNVLDIGTGDGAGAEVRSALDVTSGRMGATVAGRYVKSFPRTITAPVIGFPEDGFPYPLFGSVSRTAGTVIALDVTPRVFLGEWLAFEGQYGFEHTGAPTYANVTDVVVAPCAACSPLASSLPPSDQTVQRVGLGLRYSTLDSYLRGRARYPIEVSYRHLETITGSGGAPKLFRDQIQLRIYYRVLR
ncbi:MAG: hypothetical protein JWL95_977 [Gemmatimonadetes bacterium]|nr:hypothetical protein [Gemmatimonadota bacterium]